MSDGSSSAACMAATCQSQPAITANGIAQIAYWNEKPIPTAYTVRNAIATPTGGDGLRTQMRTANGTSTTRSITCCQSWSVPVKGDGVAVPEPVQIFASPGCASSE